MPLLPDTTTNIQRNAQKWATTRLTAKCWGKDATVPREKFSLVQQGTSVLLPVSFTMLNENPNVKAVSLSLIAWRVCLNRPRLHWSQWRAHEGKRCNSQSYKGWVSAGANVAASLEQVGETWKTKCSECVCDKDTMSAKCKPVQCPLIKPVCDVGETLSPNKDDCCKTPICGE